MFDIGFTELSLIAAIGLLVLGPERLPTVARTLGLWVGRARATFAHLRNELEREAINQDMKTRMEDQMRQMGLDENTIQQAKDSLLSPEQIAKARQPRTADEPPKSASSISPSEPETITTTPQDKGKPNND